MGGIYKSKMPIQVKTLSDFCVNLVQTQIIQETNSPYAFKIVRIQSQWQKVIIYGFPKKLFSRNWKRRFKFINDAIIGCKQKEDLILFDTNQTYVVAMSEYRQVVRAL